MKCRAIHSLAAVFLLSAPCLAGAAWSQGSSAVVRVEVSVDPASIGPSIAAELSARDQRSAFQTELARRLRMGSSGTGFFVSPEGYLVTNAHVALSGVRYRGLYLTRSEWDSMARLLWVVRDIWVTVGEGEDERSYLAEPVAIAENLDLALLRVTRPPDDDTTFPFLAIADSDAVSVGAPVRALGFSEDGFQDTSGHVLSLITGREVHERLNIVRAADPMSGETRVTVSGTRPGPVMRLHHDAPVGHGNSGGPILDANGRVIGVAYALIAERRPGAEQDPELSGLNLAIASNVLRGFLEANGVWQKGRTR